MVYKNGLNIDNKKNPENGKHVNIFVKDRFLYTLNGNCWPGQSSWIDFLNEEA